MKPKAMTKAQRLERLESMKGLFKLLTPEQQKACLNDMIENLNSVSSDKNYK